MPMVTQPLNRPALVLIHRDTFGRFTRHRVTAAAIVGRSPQAGLRIADLTVSVFHCAVLPGQPQRPAEEVGTPWYVCDLGSENGTYLNGLRLRRPTRLRRGDVISLGRTQVILCRSVSGSRRSPRI
jgi:pSer/pThr/pTyr-binding forkhead associated (FHA) protein